MKLSSPDSHVTSGHSTTVSKCMYIYIYIYLCIYIYTYVNVYIYICIYIYTHIYIYKTCIYTSLYTISMPPANIISYYYVICMIILIYDYLSILVYPHILILYCYIVILLYYYFSYNYSWILL